MPTKLLNLISAIRIIPQQPPDDDLTLPEIPQPILWLRWPIIVINFHAV